MSTNPFAAFRRLLPAQPLLVGEVTSTTGEASVITLPGGAQIAARGTGTVGSNVFFRAGVIEGPAPDLTVVDITV